MNRILPLILLPLLLLPFSMYSQHIISGTIVEAEAGKPIGGVSVVVLLSKEAGISQFALTKPNGTYSLRLQTTEPSLFLKVAALGYESQIRKLANETQQQDFELVPSAAVLKEAVAVAPRISLRGDTISYSMSSFAEVQDRTVGDVLKKLPGIDVRKDGKILYNGEAINKFYIEGLDLLQGRYNIAVNNISPDNISSVQVYENHQPVKVLEETSFSDKAAINLTLKEGAKAKWKGSGQLGGGYTPALWLGELFGMRIAKNGQSLNTYKTNNTGVNLQAEQNVLTIDMLDKLDSRVTLSNLVAAYPPFPSFLDEKRVLNNQTHMASTNTLWGLGSSYQLRLNASYLRDKNTLKMQQHTEIFLPDNSTVQIEEQKSATEYVDYLSASLNISRNTSSYYLNNTLKAEGAWNSTRLGVTGSASNSQLAKTPDRFIQNDLSLMTLSKGKRTLTTVKLESFSQYTSMPQSLTITSAGEEPIHQQAALADFMSNNSLSLTLSYRAWTLDSKLGAKVDIQRLNSKLEGLNIPLTPLHNDLSFSQVKYYYAPNLAYQTHKLTLKFDVPFEYHRIRIDDKAVQVDHSPTYLLVNPSFAASLKLTLLWTLVAKASYSKQLGGEASRLNSGFMLTSYREMMLGTDNLKEATRKNVSLGIRYRDIVSSFFTNASVQYSPSTINQVQESNFVGIYTINRLVEQQNINDMVTGVFGLSKGFDVFRSTVALNIFYSRFTSEQIQSNQPVNFTNSTLSVNPKLDIRFAKWATMEYNATWMRRRLAMDGIEGYTPSLDNLMQRVRFLFFPSDKLYLWVGGEHYQNQLDSNTSKRFSIVDVGVTYLPTRQIELRFEGTNILNSKTYSYTQYNSLSSISRSFAIRPYNLLLSASLKF